MRTLWLVVQLVACTLAAAIITILITAALGLKGPGIHFMLSMSINLLLVFVVLDRHHKRSL